MNILKKLFGTTSQCESNNNITGEAKVTQLAPNEKSDFKTVKIGNQVWMAENLNVDRYRNGNRILQERSRDDWMVLKSGAFCYYNNDPANGAIYGKLYNWHAVNDPRGLAPQGWHIPSKDEWKTLVDYLGGDDIAGGKMKEKGTKHWHKPNKDATNESGFSSLPGGYRSGNGNESSLGDYSDYWTSSENDRDTAWFWNQGYESSRANHNYTWKESGHSVRCVKD